MQVLEFKDVQDFSIQEVRLEDGHSLRISGLAFHSALAVDRVEQVTHGKTLTVRVFLCLARKGMSGRFQVDVSVPKGVRQVVFGNEGHQVWAAPDR